MHTRPLLLRLPGMGVEVDIADSGNNKCILIMFQVTFYPTMNTFLYLACVAGVKRGPAMQAILYRTVHAAKHKQ